MKRESWKLPYVKYEVVFLQFACGLTINGRGYGWKGHYGNGKMIKMHSNQETLQALADQEQVFGKAVVESMLRLADIQEATYIHDNRDI